ncbi:hypothetical protein [Paenibacillus sp. FSL W8-0194]|uniref:hypothetical protein n=1 Tax=Paenibacillus sp. FSL W8-0194 TaxID=2921711 RepID=UPI0030DA7A89
MSPVLVQFLGLSLLHGSIPDPLVLLFREETERFAVSPRPVIWEDKAECKKLEAEWKMLQNVYVS